MSAASLTERETATWVRVCAVDALFPDRGAAALVDGRQVALFRLAGEPDVVRAIGHRDPYSGANVMARGLVGTVGDVAVVVSPMHKQRFRFDDGSAVEEPSVSVGVWATRVVDGVVEVAATPLVEPRPSSVERGSSLVEPVETTPVRVSTGSTTGAPVGVSTGSTAGASAAPPVELVETTSVGVSTGSTTGVPAAPPVELGPSSVELVETTPVGVSTGSTTGASAVPSVELGPSSVELVETTPVGVSTGSTTGSPVGVSTGSTGATPRGVSTGSTAGASAAPLAP